MGGFPGAAGGSEKETRSVQGKAAASYARPMAIVGEGLKQIQDFLSAQKEGREQHYLELAGQG